LSRLCKVARADEFFSLAAQSHVGTSFEEPIHTANVTGIATLNCLEAIRLSGIHTRFYNPATSELWGGVTSGPCNEESLIYPKSPYACAKAFSFYITRNYREAYKLFASSGILFNHDCFYSNTPIILRKNGEIKIDYIANLISCRSNVSKDITVATKDYCGSNIEIWDGSDFVKLKAVSRKKLSALNLQDQYKQITNVRCGSVNTTPNHKLISESKEKYPARYFKKGQFMLKGSFPTGVDTKNITFQFAELLGLLAGNGYISESTVVFANNDVSIKDRFKKLCLEIFTEIDFRERTFTSGFNGITSCIQVNGLGHNYCTSLRNLLYDKKTKNKKVPSIILNARKSIKRLFLNGYNLADGLKKDRTSYQFKSFKTNSPLLGQGLLYLISNITKQTWCINTFEQRGHIYYQINLHSDNPNLGDKGKHLKKPGNQITKIITYNVENQHVFDIETESGKVMAGVGSLIVGNSEKRGPNFVTRKISLGVANIKYGNQDKLYLGNLNAKRDFGYANDFCRGMQMILEHNVPDDFVLGTGETHSIKEICEIAFKHAGLSDYKNYVEIDPKFFRPAEVDVLLADYSKAKRELGWEPKVKFKELIELMVDSDLEALKK
jgi:GDPmannose 4,6-dehydratase